MNDKIIKANHIDLCVETFGDPSHPAILLIMGAMASMVWWPEGFCQRLAARGRFVIRYDSRDTGRSITYEPGKPGYGVEDLPADAFGILDALGIARAHFAGMSLGGMVAQIAALEHPERVASITLISSGVFGPPDPNLPPIDPKVLQYHAAAGSLDWSDEAAAIDYMAGGWALLSGSAHPIDAPAIRAIATSEVRRARSLMSMFNHARLTGGERWYGKIGEIRTPTLIIHGTEDPVLPFEHALALEKVIPGARLIPLKGSGHEVHSADWDAIIEAIVEHTAG